MTSLNVLNWIQEWYQNQCNGDWEHSFGILIESLDNPGWDLTIDLVGTDLETLEIKYKVLEKSESDWFGFEIKEKKYHAAGDPQKLELLLLKFKELVEANLESTGKLN